jgi:hypothetical protein
MKEKESTSLYIRPPKCNFILRFDDMGYRGNPVFYQIEFTVEKTLLARLKYWLFCKFFPFKIVKWDEGDKDEQ